LFSCLFFIFIFHLSTAELAGLLHFLLFSFCPRSFPSFRVVFFFSSRLLFSSLFSPAFNRRLKAGFLHFLPFNFSARLFLLFSSLNLFPSFSSLPSFSSFSGSPFPSFHVVFSRLFLIFRLLHVSAVNRIGRLQFSFVFNKSFLVFFFSSFFFVRSFFHLSQLVHPISLSSSPSIPFSILLIFSLLLFRLPHPLLLPSLPPPGPMPHHRGQRPTRTRQKRKLRPSRRSKSAQSHTNNTHILQDKLLHLRPPHVLRLRPH